MYFDGSKTWDGSGARCFLIDPKHMENLISSHLEFECTKNISKYEVVMSGLQKAISLGVVPLKVVGDADKFVTPYIDYHLISKVTNKRYGD